MDEKQATNQGETAVERPIESDQSVIETNSQMPKPKGSKKSMMFVVLLVLLLLAGAGGLAYFVSQEDVPTEKGAAEQINASQNTGIGLNESIDSSFDFAVSDIVYSLMTDGELKREGEFGGREVYLFSSNSDSIHYYSKKSSSSDVLAIWKLENGETSSIIDFERTNKSYLPGSISPDGKRAEIFITNESGSGLSSIAILDLDTGDLTTAYETLDADVDPILIPRGWRSDSQIIASLASCLQCDGPIITELWQIDTVSNEATMLIELGLKAPSNKTAGTVLVDAPSQSAFVVMNDIVALSVDAEQIDNATNKLYKVDLTNGKESQLYEVTGLNLQIQGIASDGESILVEERGGFEDDAGFRFGPPDILQVKVDGSGTSPVSVQLSQFDDIGNYTQGMALDVVKQEFFVAVTTPAQIANRSSRTVLYALDISGGEKPVRTLYDMFDPGDNAVIKLNVDQR